MVLRKGGHRREGSKERHREEVGREMEEVERDTVSRDRDRK